MEDLNLAKILGLQSRKSQNAMSTEKVKSFEDLRIWQKARVLVKYVLFIGGFELHII